VSKLLSGSLPATYCRRRFLSLALSSLSLKRSIVFGSTSFLHDARFTYFGSVFKCGINPLPGVDHGPTFSTSSRCASLLPIS
jgi:hypothetical protein